ncbi:MAG: metalloregulator ArsR/SmtB family transcription factor [Pontiella sp.]|nr:metalloregulator ArsR/SmtB family transcription factor [Pontiella sp.]MBT8045904.1 metalloregulator ArsR/SmtB family transcription factor [Pontiella sp.]NNJ70472.1 helix-turn-helix transcriptional regulator [Kiritimatiellales bacterium]
MTTSERAAAAEVLKAIAHPVRLGVIEILAQGERTVTALYEELKCSQSMMSHQLKTLSQQKLVTIRKEGTQKYCSLANTEFIKVFSCMQNHLRNFLNFKE